MPKIPAIPLPIKILFLYLQPPGNMKKIFFLLLLILVSPFLWAQRQYVVSGKVLDKSTKAPLPFVNMIVTGHPQQGATADIDGNFRLSSPAPITSISFSYVG